LLQIIINSNHFTSLNSNRYVALLAITLLLYYCLMESAQSTVVYICASGDHWRKI